MINNFGGIIKLNRIQQGLTLDYISYKTGISKSQISRIERNKEQITFENVVKIFSVMNIEVSNENFETQFEKDFQTFYSDVVYVKDIENSYKVIRSYSDKIKSSLSYIKYLLCELIYMVMKGYSQKIETYLFIEKYFEYLESYQIQLFYDYLGVISYGNKLYKESYNYYNQAFSYRGNDYSNAMVYFHRSIPLTIFGELSDALECAIQARDIFTKTVNIKRLTSVNFQIAVIYSMNGHFRQSEKLNLACIEAFNNLGMVKEVEDTYNNLIWGYVRSREFDKIIDLENKALDIMHHDHCICFYLSYAYYKLQNKKKASEYIRKAKVQMNNPTEYMKAMINAFQVYLSKSSDERKEKQLLKVHQITKETRQYDLEVFTMELLREFYQSVHNTEKEYECMEKLIQYYKKRR